MENLYPSRLTMAVERCGNEPRALTHQPRRIDFLLFDWLKIDSLLIPNSLVISTAPQSSRLFKAREVSRPNFLPYAAEADEEEPHIKTERSSAHMKPAIAAMREGGWFAAADRFLIWSTIALCSDPVGLWPNLWRKSWYSRLCPPNDGCGKPFGEWEAKSLRQLTYRRCSTGPTSEQCVYPNQTPGHLGEHQDEGN